MEEEQEENINPFLKFRNQQGWSLRKAALVLGIHYSNLSKIENSVRRPSISQVKKLVETSKTSDVEIDELEVINYFYE